MTKIYQNKKKGNQQIMKFKNGLPDIAHVDLTYREQYPGIVVSGSNYKVITYVINYPYDPYDGTGNISAYYYGFWAAAYAYHHTNYWTGKVDLLCTNTTAAPTSGSICWGFFRYGDSIPTTATSFLSYPNTNGMKFSGGYGGDQRSQFSAKMSVWKALGRRYDPSIDNTPVASQPTERVSFTILIVNDSANAASFTMDPLFHYFITFNKFKVAVGATEFNYDPVGDPVLPADGA
jgi:hypothetical protein